MDFAVFFIGFGIGVLFVLIPAVVIWNISKRQNNAAIENMKLQFENTANRLLQDNSEKFSNKSEEKLEEYFKRFREKIENFEKKNEDQFKLELENFVKFDTNIKHFIEAGNKISQDANSLVSVMRSDNRSQGVWGELVLEKVLEVSGLRKGEEYKIQSAMAEGRPDATVLLPDGRCVYIDAKTSVSSWSKYIEAGSDDEKSLYLKDFITSTKNHISGLAKRDYSAEFASPDYVLMFIPIESCYSLMFCDDCELWNYAWKNKVMPVSPSTLLATLKIINSFHVVSRQNKNAVEISRLCANMLDKFSVLLSDLLKAKNNIDSSLVKLQGKGNILSQIEKIQDLGITISKDIPQIPEDIAE